MNKYIKIRKSGIILCVSLILTAVIVDIITKQIVVKNMQIGDSIPLIENVFHLTYIRNFGAAFGSFSNARWFYMSMSAIMLFVLSLLVALWDDRNALFYTAVSFMIGGGIGNMIDRIAYKSVVDFIDFRAFPEIWKWIFNCADIFVSVGTGLLIFYYARFEIRSSAQRKKLLTSGDNNGTEMFVNAKEYDDTEVSGKAEVSLNTETSDGIKASENEKSSDNIGT